VPELLPPFLETLKLSNLLEATEIDEFLKQHPDFARLSPEQLSKKFVEAKLLTPFQVDLLLKGRHKGFILKGKYKILNLLGAGGMGRVFLCQHLHLNRNVAVKLLSSEQAKDLSNVERFYREAKAVAALNDPNIVQVHDVERDDKMPLMVMEYVDGISLHELVSRKGPLKVEQATNFIAQTALGLLHAFEVGIVHRDIKPGNLLLDRRGVVKILDMGLARFSKNEKNEKLTERFDSNSVLGTADYLAPEQAVNSSTVDIRADLYALGGTLFYLLTGEAPFEAPTVAEKLLAHQMKPIPSLRERRKEVPQKLEQIYQRLLAKNPDDRFQTPAELVAALAPFAEATRPMRIDWDGMEETSPVQLRDQSTPRSSHRRHELKPKVKSTFSSRRPVWILGGLILLAAIALVIVILTSGSGSNATDPKLIVQKDRKEEKQPPTQTKNEKKGAEDFKNSPKKEIETPPPVIPLEDVRNHLGQLGTVEFTVERAHQDEKSQRVFLNSMSEFRSPKNFTITMSGAVFSRLYPEARGTEVSNKFLKKRIRVTGTIANFQGQTQIEIKEAGQMFILE
jgi:serine/threonine protein kinase